MKELATQQALIDSFSKLPGVGAKSAQRMAFAILEMRQEDVLEFAGALKNAAPFTNARNAAFIATPLLVPFATIPPVTIGLASSFPWPRTPMRSSP